MEDFKIKDIKFSSIINLIKKDLFLTFATKEGIFVILLCIYFTNRAMGKAKPEGIISLMIIILTYILTILTFARDKKNRPQVFIQSLPIKKRDIVFSKYISVFINFVLTIIIVGSYLWIASLFGLRTVDSLSFYLVKYTFAISIIGLSIFLPIQIILPLNIAAFVNGLIASFVMITIKIDGRGVRFSAIRIQDSKLFITAIVLYLLSIIISTWMYEKQELS